jgi:hypothetical protein
MEDLIGGYPEGLILGPGDGSWTCSRVEFVNEFQGYFQSSREGMKA